jgi:hypothetical protein
MKASELFVFAGAGLSFPPPAGLPVFWRIRDGLLSELGLHQYLPPAGAPSARPLSSRERVAQGLLPEPLLEAVERGGADVTGWLREVLRIHRPNLGHRCVARLMDQGADVWTVNFDHGIELAAGRPVRVAHLADLPSRPELHKPHGDLASRMLFQASDVMAGQPKVWETALRAAVKNKIVVFVGYSGNDLDFRPIWDDVLTHARSVVWFCFPHEKDGKRDLLRQVHARGQLVLPDPTPAVPRSNPTADFVAWCRDHRLIDVTDADLLELAARPPMGAFPALGGRLTVARAAVEAMLGDAKAAQQTLRASIVAPAPLPLIGRGRELRTYGNITVRARLHRRLPHRGAHAPCRFSPHPSVPVGTRIEAAMTRVATATDLTSGTSNQSTSPNNTTLRTARMTGAAQ